MVEQLKAGRTTVEKQMLSHIRSLGPPGSAGAGGFHVDPPPTCLERGLQSRFVVRSVDPLFGVALDMSQERLGQLIFSFFSFEFVCLRRRSPSTSWFRFIWIRSQLSLWI